MEISKETSKTIEELQILEQNLQLFIAQKQNVQIELREIENALEELSKTDDEVYKVLSGIMLKTDKEVLRGELTEKKKLLEIRLNSVEKQEKILEEKAMKIKDKITETLKSNTK